MKSFLNIALLSCALALSGCGNDQPGQATSPAATPATSPSPAEAPKQAAKTEKPQWAVLEQDVYHYPE